MLPKHDESVLVSISQLSSESFFFPPLWGIKLKYRLTTTAESVSTMNDKSPLEIQHIVIVDDIFFILSQRIRKDLKLGISIVN